MQRVDISNLKNKKVALVLSGGVVKAAAWHLGVARALEELGLVLKHNNSTENPDYEISTYVGSSAGALVNSWLASGLGPRDVIEATVGGKSDKLKSITYRIMLSRKRAMKGPPKSSYYDPFDGFPLFLRTMLSPILNIPGIFTTQGLYNYLKDDVLISNNFEDYKADVFVVATQLDNSRKVVFSKYKYPSPIHDPSTIYYTDTPFAESVAASMSVPPFYAPYPIKNSVTGHTDYYIDGEIRETLSTHVAVDNKCDFIISSWTHTPYHYQDAIGSLVNYGIPAICVQAIYLMIQKKIVSSRDRRRNAADLVNTVSDYMKVNKFSNQHRHQILSILERKLEYNKNVHFIDIYPKHENYKLFFKNSFSLNPSKTAELVTMGYKRTMEVFRNHEWES